MADNQPSLSPRRQPDDGAESLSSNVATEPTLTPASFGLPRQASRATSGGSTPSRRLSSHAIDTVLSTLRQGQADANANMERYMAMNATMMESLRSSQVEFRRTLEEQLNMFAQQVQAPVTQAVNASTTAANLTTEMAGAYVSMRQELTNAFNAAQQANADAETSRLETQ